MNTERRIYQRLPVKFVAHCTKQSNGIHRLDDLLSFTKDISYHGVRLLVSREVTIGTRLIVRLEIPAYFIPLLAYSEIVWSKDVSIANPRVPKVMELGIKFLSLDSFDRERLDNFLFQHLGAITHYPQEV